MAAGPLSAWRVVRRAFEVARHEPWRVFGAALVIFAPFAAISVGAQLVVDAVREEFGQVPGLIAIALAPATSATIWGAAFYAGVLDRTVGAHHYGRERHPTLELLRGLPLRRLILADIAFGAIVLVGYALFVVPGIIALTVFALVGPMITIEDRTVVAGFRRSAQLVFPHLWLVFGVVTAPILVEESLVHGLTELVHARASVPALAIGAGATMLVGAVVGVVEVTLAYELIHRDSGRPAVTPERRRRLIRHSLAALLGIVVVVATFAFILPRIADYGQVWDAITTLGWPQLLALAGATMLGLGAYALPWMAALPRLRFRQAFVMTQASTASSYVLPGGPAVGMATSFAMLRGWGFTAPAVTLAVAVTSAWLQLAYLGLPALGLGLLAVTGGQHKAVQTAGLLGLVAFVLVLGAFAGGLSSARLARRVGDLAARLASRALELVHRDPVTWDGESFVRFRARTLGLLRRRWHVLTAATLVQQLALFGLLLVSLRVLDVPASAVDGVEAFAAWSLGRLLGAVAITPGGIGIVELALTSLLVGFGGARAGCVAAVLVYRVLTILPTLVLGLAAAATWRRHHPGELMEPA